MPTYVAFLRAINLGAKRKFLKDDIRRVTESIGATDVATHINTGNVLLTTTMRSRAKVESALEKAFAADRGFEVPTMVFKPAELVAIAVDADELWADLGEPRAHYISLFKSAPSAAATSAVHNLDLDGEVVRVVDRAAHVLLHREFHENRALSSREFKALGEGTARNVTVIRALATKWG
ncbi:DUF1697 domain-containing protein [Nocardioides sp. InS609-2]|uniref:DUF1697 domain-containing protein n=1 Tax=Nocardioides sp. InS609-2 TaxID=2760705 RepID=UPI0020C05F79|nr:DUF1697 domain-containing protein [Nocardioides sp. InS609-2]